MAHFYGTLQGAWGGATRCGTKGSGLSVTAASWAGAITVEIQYNADTDTDCVRVYKHPWHGRGEHRVLYDGPIGKMNLVEHAVAEAIEQEE